MVHKTEGNITDDVKCNERKKKKLRSNKHIFLMIISLIIL